MEGRGNIPRWLHLLPLDVRYIFIEDEKTLVLLCRRAVVLGKK